MTRLLLVRHAQSQWNAIGRWQGQADPPLSPLGLRQARTATLRESVDAVVSSPLVRAYETASILAAQAGLQVAETVIDLQERAAGEWTGLTRAEIADLSFGNPRLGDLPPGAESDDTLCRRARTALLELADRYPDATVLVVTHGGVIGVINDFLAAQSSAPSALICNLGGSVVLARDDQLEAAGTIRLAAL